MRERGASKREVAQAIAIGERVPAKKGRESFRLNFQFNGVWSGRRYPLKQVMPIVKEESDKIVVITVYVFYF